MFGVPESWAGITSPPWPALSDTIGHLEQLWHPVRVIVVTLIVFAAFHAVTYPPGRAGEPAVPESKPARGRTPCGRFARAGTGAASAVPVIVYFPAAIGVVAGGSILAAAAGGGMFVLGYVIYGLTAIFLVLIPNALAARRAAIPTALQPAPPPSTPAQPVFARAGEPARPELGALSLPSNACTNLARQLNAMRRAGTWVARTSRKIFPEWHLQVTPSPRGRP